MNKILIYTNEDPIDSTLLNDFVRELYNKGFKNIRVETIDNNGKTDGLTEVDVLLYDIIIYFQIKNIHIISDKVGTAFDTLKSILNLSRIHKDKIFVPILSWDVVKHGFKKYYNLEDIIVYKGDLNEVINYLDSKILIFHTQRDLAKLQDDKEKIESTYKSYLDAAIKDLNNREKSFKNIARNWYLGGLFLLLSSFGCSIYIFHFILNNYDIGRPNWQNYLIISVKGLIAVSVLLTSSKYCYSLGKSYMGESLKISDRKHAIRFGEVYLQIVDNKLDPSDLKEVFKDWNISNQTSNFSEQKVNDIENTMWDKIIEFTKAVKK